MMISDLLLLFAVICDWPAIQVISAFIVFHSLVIIVGLNCWQNHRCACRIRCESHFDLIAE